MPHAKSHISLMWIGSKRFRGWRSLLCECFPNHFVSDSVGLQLRPCISTRDMSDRTAAYANSKTSARETVGILTDDGGNAITSDNEKAEQLNSSWDKWLLLTQQPHWMSPNEHQAIYIHIDTGTIDFLTTRCRPAAEPSWQSIQTAILITY